ncbi:molecular chaperone TorD family protein [Halorubrum rutilum]|uniref:Molecular chaperone TorD family protein n=1 Tax=Halorubrum rutilum TaxID=1364933 RepID=A0ABD6AMJ5_9EURY|nr:molecular chaperone TorD family protein [Halorubrum rutilum]
MTVSESTADRNGDFEDSEHPDGRPPDEAVDTETGARGAVYGLLASAFDEPTPEPYEGFADGSIDRAMSTLVARSGLDVDPPDLTVDDDRETLAARYNDLFVVGYSEVIDGTDGTIENQGPPASLYESTYRSDASWNDVNLDLARAYEHFGCEVGGDERRHHDNLRLEVEFAGYLCRLAAATEGDGDGYDRARLDFHDRHLSMLAAGLDDALDSEPGTGVYGRLAAFLAEFVAADVSDLAARLDVGAGSGAESDSDGGEDA